MILSLVEQGMMYSMVKWVMIHLLGALAMIHSLAVQVQALIVGMIPPIIPPLFLVLMQI